MYSNCLSKMKIDSHLIMRSRTECFCGNEEPPSASRRPDSSCNMKCPADPREACGGYFTINVYETGIASKHLTFWLLSIFFWVTVYQNLYCAILVTYVLLCSKVCELLLCFHYAFHVFTFILKNLRLKCQEKLQSLENLLWELPSSWLSTDEHCVRCDGSSKYYFVGTISSIFMLMLWV